MTEFLIGAITGAIALWIATVNRFRFPIYDKRFDIYGNINKFAIELLQLDPEDEAFNTTVKKITSETFPNSLIISDPVLNAVSKFTACDFSPDINKEQEQILEKAYYNLLNLMRDELQITFMSELNRIFSNPTRINLNKVLLGLRGSKNKPNHKSK